MITRFIYRNYFQKQKKAIRAITFCKWNASSAPFFNKLKLLKLRKFNVLQTCFVFKSIHGLLPSQFKDMFLLNNEMYSYDTRNKDNNDITSHGIKVRTRSIKVYGFIVWNSLNQHLKDCLSINVFKRHCKNYILFTRPNILT